MIKYFIIIFSSLFFIVKEVDAQVDTSIIQEFQSKVNSSNHVYFKILSEHYEGEQKKQGDTTEYVKNDEYSSYSSKTTAWVIDTHRLLIDHENKMIVLIPFSKKMDTKESNFLKLDSTQNADWQYNTQEKYFYTTSNKGNSINEFRAYFNSSNQLIKTIFISEKNNLVSKDVITYLDLCLEKGCISRYNTFHKFNDVVIQKGKNNWELTDIYKAYDLNVY